MIFRDIELFVTVRCASSLNQSLMAGLTDGGTMAIARVPLAATFAETARLELRVAPDVTKIESRIRCADPSIEPHWFGDAGMTLSKTRY